MGDGALDVWQHRATETHPRRLPDSRQLFGGHTDTRCNNGHCGGWPLPRPSTSIAYGLHLRATTNQAAARANHVLAATIRRLCAGQQLHARKSIRVATDTEEVGRERGVAKMLRGGNRGGNGGARNGGGGGGPLRPTSCGLRALVVVSGSRLRRNPRMCGAPAHALTRALPAARTCSTHVQHRNGRARVATAATTRRLRSRRECS